MSCDWWKTAVKSCVNLKQLAAAGKQVHLQHQKGSPFPVRFLVYDLLLHALQDNTIRRKPAAYHRQAPTPSRITLLDCCLKAICTALKNWIFDEGQILSIGCFNPFKPEFTIVIHYKPRIAVAILDL